jgi:hypothetical protein
MATTLTIGTDVLSNTPSSDPTKQLIVQANQVAGQLNNQTKAYLLTLTTVLQPILVGDYGKLSSFGQRVDSNLWTWDDTVSRAAVSGITATTTQAVYSGLLPVAWPLVELKPDLITQFQSADVTTFICYHPAPETGVVSHVNDPFGHEEAYNQFASLFQLTIVGSKETSNYEAWTWANYDVNSQYTERPLDSTFHDDLFFSAADAAGAGAYPAAWFRSTYNPPDFVRCGSTSGHTGTAQHPAKAISPTAAGYTLG